MTIWYKAEYRSWSIHIWVWWGGGIKAQEPCFRVKRKCSSYGKSVRSMGIFNIKFSAKVNIFIWYSYSLIKFNCWGHLTPVLNSDWVNICPNILKLLICYFVVYKSWEEEEFFTGTFGRIATKNTWPDLVDFVNLVKMAYWYVLPW